MCLHNTAAASAGSPGTELFCVLHLAGTSGGSGASHRPGSPAQLWFCRAHCSRWFKKDQGEGGRGLIHIFQQNKKERKGKESRRETCAFFVLAQGSLGHALKLSRRVRKASQGLSLPRPCVGWSRSVVTRTDDTRASLSVCARGPSVCTRRSLLRVGLRLADCCLCRYSASDAQVSDL